MADSMRIPPVKRPDALDHYIGMWVALVDNQYVVASAPTSRALAREMTRLSEDVRKRAVACYVEPPSHGYRIGLG